MPAHNHPCGTDTTTKTFFLQKRSSLSGDVKSITEAAEGAGAGDGGGGGGETAVPLMSSPPNASLQHKQV